MTNIRFGRLNLVDLAGSERLAILTKNGTSFETLSYFFECDLTIHAILCRQKSSGAEGERLKEAANINKSLSTLGYESMRF